MEKHLQKHRTKIDDIDEKILELLNKRAELVIDIGKIKKEKKFDFHVPTREREIYKRLESLNKGPFPNESVKSVFREILSAALSLESPLKVCYLGPQATFTHLACQRKFGYSAIYISVNSIREVFNEVERGRVSFGVVPIENSTEGVVNHTLDMFMDSNLNIVSEILLEVSHHLLSKTGKIEDIKKIYSHPHAIAQCKGWLESNLPNIPKTEVYSTGKAAEICIEDPTAAAIASEMAAKMYNLNIVKKRIEDNINNYTRFLVISKNPAEKTGKDKTSIMFSVKDKVGALHNMLEPFSKQGINLNKIESRPSKKKAWEYVFYLDMEGHIEDEKIKNALKDLEGECIFFKILGSYPFGELV